MAIKTLCPVFIALIVATPACTSESKHEERAVKVFYTALYEQDEHYSDLFRTSPHSDWYVSGAAGIFAMAFEGGVLVVPKKVLKKEEATSLADGTVAEQKALFWEHEGTVYAVNAFAETIVPSAPLAPGAIKEKVAAVENPPWGQPAE